MACAITTQWGNHVYWIPPNRNDISHYNLFRRIDEVAPVGTADIVAHVPFILATASTPHYFDPFTAINTAIAYTYWVKSVAWDGKSSALSVKITAISSPSAIQTSIYTNGTAILTNLTICNALTVCGITTLTGNVSVSGTLHVSSAVTFSSTLTVGGAVSLSSTLWVCGSTTLNGATISGNVTMGTLNVTANVSVGGTLHICGASTLNGLTNSGDITTGTLNVTSSISVQNTMHVCGASTFGSTVVISSTLSINSNALITGYITVGQYIAFTSTTTVVVTAPGSGVRLFGKDSAGLTKLIIVDSAGTELQIGAGGGGGNAVYLEADGAAKWDTTGAAGYLVFDNAIFSATTTGQCAVVTITTDAIDDTLIDWGDAAGQVASDDIPLGSATDSSWADGISVWTNNTTVAAALDDINETLSYLAPDDAIALSGNLNGYVSFGGAAMTKYAGRLSDGNINYK